MEGYLQGSVVPSVGNLTEENSPYVQRDPWYGNFGDPLYV
jgi:hypothetical protein